MKIFFTRISEFLRIVNKSLLDKIYHSEKKNIESQLGRLLVKYIAFSVFGVNNTEIILKDKKPYFKDADIYFSISHSDDIVGVAFDNQEIGFDIEKVKSRDLKKLSRYFKKEFKTLEEFYKYWTLYEAKYKSKLKGADSTTFKFEDYFVSLFAQNVNEVKVYEVIPEGSPPSIEDIKFLFKEYILD